MHIIRLFLCLLKQVGDVQCVSQYVEMNTEGHLKGGTNQYAVIQTHEGSTLSWIASFRLVANIKPQSSDLTLDVMRPLIQLKRKGALRVKYKHTYLISHITKQLQDLYCI